MPLASLASRHLIFKFKIFIMKFKLNVLLNLLYHPATCQ